MSKLLTVTKSNELIKASYRLTLLEKRIILFGIAKINPMRAENDMPLTHTINITELADFYNIERTSLYSSVKTALCEHLFNRKIVIKTGDDKEGTLDRWIDHVHYDENSKTFTYHFNSRLKEHLINLEENFTKYTLKNMEHLKSIYSIRLYEICVFRINASKKDNISFSYSVSKIKEMLEPSAKDIFNFLEKNLTLKEYNTMKEFIIYKVKSDILKNYKIDISYDDITLISLEKLRIHLDEKTFMIAEKNQIYPGNLRKDYPESKTGSTNYYSYWLFGFLYKPTLSKFETLFLILGQFSQKHDVKLHYDDKRAKEIFSM